MNQDKASGGEGLSDEQIANVAREWFCKGMGDKEGDWGPNTLNQQWLKEIGIPFARAILAASIPPVSEGDESTRAVHLTPDEIAFVMNELRTGHHDGSEFEPECPSCTAFKKLAASGTPVGSEGQRQEEAVVSGYERDHQRAVRAVQKAAEHWPQLDGLSPENAIDTMRFWMLSLDIPAAILDAALPSIPRGGERKRLCRDCADFAQDGICPNDGKPCSAGMDAPRGGEQQ